VFPYPHSKKRHSPGLASFPAPLPGFALPDSDKKPAFYYYFHDYEKIMSLIWEKKYIKYKI
jgi:hypothetical protein